jgi:diguanylate cyclase (GGDEF)-like protein
LVNGGFALLVFASFAGYLAVDASQRGLVFLAVNLLPILAIEVGRRLNKITDVVPWHLLAGGVALLAVPHLLRVVDPAVVELSHYQLVRHGCMALGYVGLLCGSIVLVLRHAPHDPGGILEATLVGVSGAGVIWELLLRPRLVSQGVGGGGQFAVLVEVLILMALLGALLRVATTTVRARGTLFYLFISTAGTLLGITVSAATSGGQGVDYPPWVRIFWFVGYLGVAAAALHPAAAHLSRPDNTVTDRLTPQRLVRIGLMLLASPVVAGFSQAFGHAPPDVLVLSVSTAFVIPLVLLRFWQLAEQRSRAEHALAYQATHDELTGLPNRRAVLTGMEAVLDQRADGDAPLPAVIFCDLDGFKPINDTLGHKAGDVVLREVGRRLQQCVRADDVVGRLGGDEFLIFCPEITDAEVRQLIDRVHQAIRQPMTVAGSSCTIGTSVGVAFAAPGLAEPADRLIDRADAAMYEQKRRRPRDRRSTGALPLITEFS